MWPTVGYRIRKHLGDERIESALSTPECHCVDNLTNTEVRIQKSSCALSLVLYVHFTELAGRSELVQRRYNYCQSEVIKRKCLVVLRDVPSISGKFRIRYARCYHVVCKYRVNFGAGLNKTVHFGYVQRHFRLDYFRL